MANKTKGAVQINAGGEAYTLRFSTNALAEIEDAFEMSIDEFGGMIDGKSIGVKQVREIIRCGLIDNHPELTVQDVGQIIDDLGGVQPAADLMVQALTLAFPQAGIKKKTPRGKSGIGKK